MAHFLKFCVKPDIALAERKHYLKHILFKLPFKKQWHRTIFFQVKGQEEQETRGTQQNPISCHETTFPGSASEVKNTMCDPDNMSSIKDLE